MTGIVRLLGCKHSARKSGKEAEWAMSQRLLRSL